MLDRILQTQVLKNQNRISSIDVFRALAILFVVVYHFNEDIKMGYLGVDLFFVISGLLIGKILIKEYIKRNTIHYFKFFLSRGFKIWPSYYVFMLLGNLLAFIFYHKTAPTYVIPLNDMPRYLFFYKNFFGTQYHWCFEHVWSLCVEEHFYLFFPLLFLLLGIVFKKIKSSKVILFTSIVLAIVLSILLRFLLIEYFGNSINQYECTLVRIHELLFGVLVGLILVYYENVLKKTQMLPILFIVGLLLFVFLLMLFNFGTSIFFQKHIFPVAVPFSFAMMLLGAYFLNFYNWYILRLMAIYSYNWYLWHTVFVKFIQQYFTSNIFGLLFYVVFTFVVAVFFTLVVEERFLKYRSLFLKRYFPD